MYAFLVYFVRLNSLRFCCNLKVIYSLMEYEIPDPQFTTFRAESSFQGGRTRFDRGDNRKPPAKQFLLCLAEWL